VLGPSQPLRRRHREPVAPRESRACAVTWFLLVVPSDYDTIALDPREWGVEALSRRMMTEARCDPRSGRLETAGRAVGCSRTASWRSLDGLVRNEEPTMGVESGALIKTLNTTCVNALQAAAGLCLSRTNPSVEVEHWLTKLVEAPNTDLTRILRHFEVDTARLLRDLTKVMDGFRTGNQ